MPVGDGGRIRSDFSVPFRPRGQPFLTGQRPRWPLGNCVRDARLRVGPSASGAAGTGVLPHPPLPSFPCPPHPGILATQSRSSLRTNSAGPRRVNSPSFPPPTHPPWRAVAAPRPSSSSGANTSLCGRSARAPSGTYTWPSILPTGR